MCAIAAIVTHWTPAGCRLSHCRYLQAHLRRVTPEEVHLSAASAVDDVTRAQAASIIDEVRAGGEAALLNVAVRLRDLASVDEPYVMERPELERRFLELPLDQQELLQRVASRVKTFAAAQLASIQAMHMSVPGGSAGHTVRSPHRRGTVSRPFVANNAASDDAITCPLCCNVHSQIAPVERAGCYAPGGRVRMQV